MKEAVLKFLEGSGRVRPPERLLLFDKVRKALLKDFFERLRASPPEKRVLVLDYDGTLSPFNEDPLRAFPYAGVVERLDAISEAGTRLAIATGRKVMEIPQLLYLKHPVEICGVHGWERQSAQGVFTQTPVPPAKRRALDVVESWMREPEKRGAWYERKHASVVLHWRGLMNAGEHETIKGIIAHIDKLWNALNRRDILVRYPADGGLEIRAKGWDKGKVVTALMQNAAVGAFLGDDSTDEDAFRAIKYNDALRRSMLGILVRPEWKPSTDATVHLRPPEELLEFLDWWCDACTVRPSIVSLPRLNAQA